MPKDHEQRKKKDNKAKKTHEKYGKYNPRSTRHLTQRLEEQSAPSCVQKQSEK